MTNTEIVDKYLAHIHYTKVSGDSILPVMPFIVMDVVYNMYSKTIRPVPAKHKVKLLKRKWEESYNRFDRMFLAAFTPDEQDEVFDRIDNLEDYIANYKTIAEVQTMNCFSFLDLEHQKVLACANICNILTHYAAQTWSICYKNFDRFKGTKKAGERYYKMDGKIYKEIDTRNKDLDTIEYASEKFMDEYYAQIGGPDVKLDNCPQMKESCIALVKKMYQWLKEA